MNRRILALAALAVLTCLLVFFLSRPHDKPPAPPAPPRIQPPPPSTPAASRTLTNPDPARAEPAEISATGIPLLPGIRELFADFHEPAETPTHDLEILEETLARYRHTFGQNPPGGTNLEIVTALLGRNSKNLAILPPDLPALNAKGEITDRWGTPFFFHPVSSVVLEILSAGPDTLLWTSDDLGKITPVAQETR